MKIDYEYLKEILNVILNLNLSIFLDDVKNI